MRILKICVVLISCFLFQFLHSQSVISVNKSTYPQSSYSIEDLIKKVLIGGEGSDCMVIENIKMSPNMSISGNNRNYGYFNKENTAFPFKEGIFLSTGKGGVLGNTIQGTSSGYLWGGGIDTDLSSVMPGYNQGFFDISYIEFDFIPLKEEISFNYLMASTEYTSGYPCSFSDTFALLIKKIGDPTYTNIAVLPNNDFVSVTNIHPEIDSSCDSKNEEFYAGGTVYAPIIPMEMNMNGRTVPLVAKTKVIPCQKYHFKLVIADYKDPSLDSAVFLEAGSLDLNLDVKITDKNDIELGDTVYKCEGDAFITLKAPINSNIGCLSTQWYKDGIPMPGENTNQINISAPGTYKIIVGVDLPELSNCSISKTIKVENKVVKPVITGDLSYCKGSTTTISTTNTYDTYEWKQGASVLSTTNTLTVTTPGTYTLTVTKDGCSASTLIEVTEKTIPPPVITGDLSYCKGSTTTISTTNTYDTYEWKQGASVLSTTNTLTVTAPGTYTLTVTKDGCSASTLIEVTEKTIPPPVITGDLSYCKGSTTTISTTNTYDTYEWKQGASVLSTTNTLTVTTPGTYTLTVTKDGCSASTLIEVTEKTIPPPVITGDLSYCKGSTTTISTTNTYDTYEWKQGASVLSTTNTLTVTAPGTYTLTVTKDGCSASTLIEVTEKTIPPPVITGDLSYCKGSTTTISTTNTYDTYEWKQGASVLSTTHTLTVTSPGTYTLTVTKDGCSASTLIEVTEKTITPPVITGDLSYCKGESTVLSTTNTYDTYEWKQGASVLSTTHTLTITAPGTYTLTVTKDGCTAISTITITEKTIPPPVITGDLSYCKGSTTTVSTTNTYDTYEWKQGASVLSTTNTLTVTTPGTYNLTVTKNGCTAVGAVTLTEKTIKVPVISGDLTYCEYVPLGLVKKSKYVANAWAVGSTQLSTTTDYDTYEWKLGAVVLSTTHDLTVTAPGTYTLTVTKDGCVASKTVTVKENSVDSPIITGELSYCKGESTILSTDLTYDTYEWKQGAVVLSTTHTLSVTAPGTYTLTVTKDGCSASTLIEVTEKTIPPPVITGDLSYCKGSTTTISTTNTYDTYEWKQGASVLSTTNTLTVTTPGTYTLTVTKDGCSASTLIEVTEKTIPPPVITGDLSYCKGSTTTISTTNTYDTYEWKQGASVLSTTNTLTVTAPGTYTLTVTKDGCSASTLIEVTEKTIPPPVITGDLSYCKGSTTTISTTNTYDTYEWKQGASVLSTTHTLTVTSPGTYTLTVTKDGCSASTLIEVTEKTITPPVITGDLSYCKGESTVLSTTNTYDTYEWKQGASVLSTTHTLTVTAPGTYTLTVTKDGCTAISTITITEKTIPPPVITGDLSYCKGSTTTVSTTNTYDTYEWKQGASVLSTTNTLTVTTPGTYNLTVTKNGCTAVGAVTLTEKTIKVPVISGDLTYCEYVPLGLVKKSKYVANAWAVGSTQLSTTTDYDTYEWKLGAVVLSTTHDLTVTAPGTYTLTVTKDGCVASKTVTVKENSVDSPIITGELSYCKGESTILSTDLTYDTYEWKQGAVVLSTTHTLSVTAPGTYTLTVTKDGCSASSLVEVEEKTIEVPVITGDLSYCKGESTLLSTTATYDDYEWKLGSTIVSTTHTLTVNNPGTYLLTVTKGGCVTSKSFIVKEKTIKVPVISGDLSYCKGESTLLSTTATYDTYEWKQGSTIVSTTNTLTVTAPGTYTLTVTKDGCTAGSTVTIIEKTITPPVVTGDLSFCKGSTTTVSTTNTYDTYEWKQGATTVLSTTNTLTVTSPGTYTLTVTKNGCTAVSTVKVIEKEVILPVIKGNLSFCKGEFTALSFTEVYDIYYWMKGSTNLGSTQNLIVNQPGIYTLVVSKDGCTASVSVTVVEKYVDPPVINGQLEFCDGLSSQLSVSPIYDSYEWSKYGIFLSNKPSIKVTQAGVYTLTVTKNGCTNSSSVTVTVLETPNIVGVEVNSVKGKAEIITNPAGSYLYSLDMVHWQFSNTFIDLDYGNYQVWVKTTLGCMDSTSFVIEEIHEIPNIITPNDDGVNDRWVVKGLKKGTLVKVYNRYGKPIFEEIVKKDRESVIWDGKYLGRKVKTASYWYHIITPDAKNYTGFLVVRNYN